MGFFDDIYVPAVYLPKPSTFDSNERAFFWIPDSELSTPTELLDTDKDTRMYIDTGELVRVRVESDEFYDDEPGPPQMLEGIQVKKEPRRAPYQIIVSVLCVAILQHLTLVLVLHVRTRPRKCLLVGRLRCGRPGSSYGGRVEHTACCIHQSLRPCNSC